VRFFVGIAAAITEPDPETPTQVEEKVPEHQIPDHTEVMDRARIFRRKRIFKSRAQWMKSLMTERLAGSPIIG
jgi:hypothetical protein